MSIEFHDQVTIGGHWLPALIYGDTSGLSVPECKQIIRWSNDNPELAAGVFDVVENESHFARDLISGLHADCYTVDLYVYKGADNARSN